MDIEKIVDSITTIDMSVSEAILIYLLSKNDKRYDLIKNNKVEKIMSEKKMIKIVGDKPVLLYSNPTVKSFMDKIEKKDLSSFDKLLREFRKEYSKYKGISSDGRKYDLLSRTEEDKRALILFKEKNPNISNEDILEALKMYVAYNTNSAKCIPYAPKSSSFILGTDNKEYLINYCYKVNSKRIKESEIRSEEDNYGNNYRELV